MNPRILHLIGTVIFAWIHARAEDPEIFKAIDSTNALKVCQIVNADKSQINSKDENGFTTLHRATDKAMLPIAQVLIDSGADINAKSTKWGTLVQHAVGDGNLELVKLLISKGVDLKSVGDDGLTVMHRLAWISDMETARSMFSLLYSHEPALLESFGNCGFTPLFECVDRVNNPVAVILVANGADPTKKTTDGQSAESFLIERLIKEPGLRKQLSPLAETLRVSTQDIDSKTEPTGGAINQAHQGIRQTVTEKMESIKIPRMTIQDMPINQAMKQIEVLSKNLDIQNENEISKGVKIEFDPQSLRKAQVINVSLSLVDIPLGEAIKTIIAVGGLTSKVEENKVIITEASSARQSEGKIIKPNSDNSSAIDYNSIKKFIVSVEGNKSVGTGFIVRSGEKSYIYTNLHVLDGNRTISFKSMNGGNFLPGKLLVSNEYDLAAIELPNEHDGLILQDQVDQNVAKGEEVKVFGNSLGGGVATDLNGTILALGPELIETDVKFVSGNSGSPIIAKKTGKVLGICSYSIIHKANEFGKDSKFNNVECRFAYRTDNNPSWQETTLSQFLNDGFIIKNIENRSESLWNVAKDIAKNNKITSFSKLNISDPQVIQSIQTYGAKMNSLSVGSPSSWEDYRDSHERLLNGLLYAGYSDLGVRHNYCSWHLKTGIEPNKEVRDVLKQFFEKTKKELADRFRN